MPDKKPQSKPAAKSVAAQVADRINDSTNVLVALSKNPSVDELSAALGLTFILDKLGKHATAIFSGEVPNAIEFLEPEKTFESNTNSLQDFIIALDKNKADHLRYKIEGDYVKVFITPYRTMLSEDDLEYSHGDYNVDLVIAINVSGENDFDAALSEYGRIKHDASSINISVAEPGKFADLEWGDPNASSVSEMVADLGDILGGGAKDFIEKATATALLAGIVAATNRFSNEHTSSETMSIAAHLMDAGADQQLISSSIPVDILTQDVVDVNDEFKEDTIEEIHPIRKAKDTIPDLPAPEPAPVAPTDETPVAPVDAPEIETTAIPSPVEGTTADAEMPAPDYANAMAQELEAAGVEPEPETPPVVQAAELEPSPTPIPAAPAPAANMPAPAESAIDQLPTAELPSLEAPVAPQLMGDDDIDADAVPVVPAEVVNQDVAEPVTTPPSFANPTANIDPALPPVAPMGISQEEAEVVAPPTTLPSDGGILPPPPPVSFDMPTMPPAAASAPIESSLDSAPMPAEEMPSAANNDPASSEVPVEPIMPAVLQEEELNAAASPSVNGVNPVLQDQVYSDPGSFKIPGM